MSIGLRLSERMAGWICFDRFPESTNPLPLELGTQYPFEFSINAFTSNPFQFPWALPFLGTAGFPGLPCPPHIPESQTHPPLQGTLFINPFKGVAYQLSLSLPEVGQLDMQGAKKYQFFTLSWFRFRSSLVTLPLEVTHNGEVMGRAQVTYLEPLWRFPLGLSLVHQRWAHHPHRKLAVRMARLTPVICPDTESLSPEDKVIDKLERQLIGSRPTVVWITWLCTVLIYFVSLLRFGRRPHKLKPTQQETFAHLLSSHALLYSVSLPITAPLTSSIFSSEAYLEAHNQHRPARVTQSEEERWMELNHTPTRQLGEEEIEVDVVVVGSGAGGGAAAYELARQGHAVAIVEEGHYFKRTDMTGQRIDMMEKMYRHQGQTFALSNAPLWIPSGRCVGGTTTINCGTSFRTPPQTLQRWKDEFGLTEVDLEPYFSDVETMLDIKPTPKELQGGIAEVLEKGLKGKPYTFHALPRGESSCDGQTFCAIGCPTGAKRSTDVSYIPEALKKNAYLFSHYKVTDFMMEEERVVGVKAYLEGYGRQFPIRFRAKKIILAAGSFGTPYLLNKIKQGRALPQLGKNLSLHPAISFGALFDSCVRKKMYVPQAVGIFDLPTDEIFLEGYTFSADTLPAAVANYGLRLKTVMDQIDHFASFSALLVDRQKGSLYFSKSECLPIYYIDKSTIELLKQATNLVADIFFSAGARFIYLPIKGFEMITQRGQLEDLMNSSIAANRITLSAHHPLGTCRMGTNQKNSVTNSWGAVWGVKNLYISDGSIIPGPIGVNPQVTIMANATRIAQHIGGTLS